MAYQVLARKWRPQDFSAVIGQEPIVTALRNALTDGRIAQAYLFSGIRGVGKTSVARILAKALNCERGPAGDPCNECAVCREITAGADFDVLEVDAATYSKVEQVRELTESLRYQPARDRYKVVIVDEIHRLSRQAFDALLKIVEEPPPYLIFIFATTESEAVPATILSRCQEYRFRRVPAEALARHLGDLAAREEIEVGEAALGLLARAGDGSVRDSVALLDQLATFGSGKISDEEAARVLGGVDHDVFHRLLGAILDGDAQGVSEIVAAVEAEGWDPRHVYSEFLSYCRDALHLSLGGAAAALPGEAAAALARRIAGTEYENLLRLLNQLLESESAVRRSETGALALEIAWLRAAELPKLVRVEELLAGGGGASESGPGRGRGRAAPAAGRSATTDAAGAKRARKAKGTSRATAEVAPSPAASTATDPEVPAESARPVDVRPEPEVPAASKREGDRSETAGSETAGSETAGSETAQPEIASSEVASSKAAVPDAADHGADSPRADNPGAASPKAASQGKAPPEAPRPETAARKTTAEEAAEPQRQALDSAPAASASSSPSPAAPRGGAAGDADDARDNGHREGAGVRNRAPRSDTTTDETEAASASPSIPLPEPPPDLQPAAEQGPQGEEEPAREGAPIPSGGVAKFLERVSVRKQLLAAHLGESQRLVWTEGTLEIHSLEGDDWLTRERLERDSNRRVIERALTEVWGKGASWKLVCLPPEPSREVEPEEPVTAETEAHPRVQAVLDIFGGTVESVRPDPSPGE